MEALQRASGARIVGLLKSDAPRVAGALTAPRATVKLRNARGVLYVEVSSPAGPSAFIRQEEWRKIAPFVRYARVGINVPVLGPDAPAEVMSPQPKLTIPPPPINPGPGLTSLLAGLSYEDYRQIVNLLPLTQTGAPAYDWLVAVLEVLFPADFGG